jgi:hypothetical protein
MVKTNEQATAPVMITTKKQHKSDAYNYSKRNAVDKRLPTKKHQRDAFSMCQEFS